VLFANDAGARLCARRGGRATVRFVQPDDDRPATSRGLPPTQAAKLLTGLSLLMMVIVLPLGIAIDAAAEGRLLLALACFVLACSFGSGVAIWFSARGWLPPLQAGRARRRR
jgi:hypothetical protein